MQLSRMAASLVAMGAVMALLASRTASAAPAILLPQTPVVVPGGAGHFDWMTVDTEMGRLFACHPGTKSVAMMDLRTGKVSSLDAGDVNGLGIDPVDGKYYAAGAGEKVAVLDRKTLARIGEIPLAGPGDAVLFDPRNRTIYVDHDDGTDVWTINPATDKVTGSVTIAGPPEDIQYDPNSDRLFQNIKTTNVVQVIDPGTAKLVASWPTAPVESPHGLAIDTRRGRLFTAGSNGKLAVIDTDTGKVVASVDIAKRVDQIAFDPRTRRFYCACAGEISVVQETPDGGVSSLGSVHSPQGAHTLTVDPLSGDVWICYSDAKDSYLQRFTLP